MTAHERLSRVHRGKALVTAGVAVALAVGGVALAAPSNAAPPNLVGSLAVTVSGFNSHTVNDGVSGWSPMNAVPDDFPNSAKAQVNIKNITGQNLHPDAGTEFAGVISIAGVGGTVLTQQMFLAPFTRFEVNGSTLGPFLSAPLGLPCDTGAFCDALSFGSPSVIAHNQNETDTFSLQLDTRTITSLGITGDYTVSFDIAEIGLISHHVVKLMGSASATSTLAPASAPTFGTIAGAIINQPYSATVVTSAGFPAAPNVDQSKGANPGSTLNLLTIPGFLPGGGIGVYDAGYRVYAHHTDGSFTRVNMTGGPIGGVYDLNHDLVFNPATGKVTANEYETAPAGDDPTVVSYTVVANNGFGGSTTHIGGNLSAGVIPIMYHDVSTVIDISVSFTDVPASNPEAAAIYALAADGIMQGYADGSFKPGNPITRQEYAHTIAEYLDWGLIPTSPQFVGTGPCSFNHTSPFTDVPVTSQFCAEIRDLAEAGVVHGFGNSKFGPNVNISRDQMSALLFRVHEATLGLNLNGGVIVDPTCTSAPFSDVPVSNVFCGDIAWLKLHNISVGYTDGTYRPATPTTRGDAAQFLFNLAGYDLIPL